MIGVWRALPVLASESQPEASPGWEWLGSVEEFLLSELGVLSILVALWLMATAWYRSRAARAEASIPLAPILVKDGKVGDREIYEGVRGQLEEIRQIFARMAPGQGVKGVEANVIAPEDREQHELVRMVMLPTEVLPDTLQFPTLKVPIGPVKVPLKMVVLAIKKLLCIVPYRRKYKALLINVSITFVGSEGTEVNVWRGERSLSATVTKTDRIKDLYRTIAFMVLGVRGESYSRNAWKGLVKLADGLHELYLYRCQPKAGHFSRAIECFAASTAADPNNAQALYFHGVTAVMERKDESVDIALRDLENAKQILKSPGTRDEWKLRALVRAGLAFCHSQRWHRLARRQQKVLDAAMREANAAKEEWDAVSDEPDFVILYAQVMARTVDEGSEKDRPADRKRFLEAAGIALQALDVDPGRAQIQNHLGWIFLHLTEWGNEEITGEDGVPDELLGRPHELAEGFLRDAFSGHRASPRISKLSHANLCLLYATPPFRLSGQHAKYRRLCAGQAKSAIGIDAKYVNGCRDYALSLLRYALHRGPEPIIDNSGYDGEDEAKAFVLFGRALELCRDQFRGTAVEKKLEILEDARRAMEELRREGVRIDSKLKKRWIDFNISKQI